MKQLYILRRTLSAIILLLASAIPCMAIDFEVDGIKYSVNENGEIASVTVVKNTTNYSGDIVIPSTVTHDGITYSVTSIGDNAFYGCTSLTSISIPEGVTCIGEVAFAYCTSLTSIYIPESVTSIKRAAFGSCEALTSISLTEGLTSIGSSAFACCEALTSISLPESVTSIGDFSFGECTSLTSISIPKDVTSIGYEVLVACSSLTSITVSPENTVYDSREGCNALIETSTNTLIAACQSTIIPESVTRIGDGAFDYCTSLTSISLPEGVTSIGEGAFYDCTSLTSISLPEGMTSIGEGAFYGCTSLTSISLPEGLTSIGSGAFCDCTSLTSISLPEGVTSIGDVTFAGCTSLTTIVCRANEVPELGNNAFADVPQCGATLYVPSSSIEAYGAADQWKDFGNILTLEEYTTGIASTTAQSEDSGVYDVYTIRGTLIRKGCNLNGLPAGAYILRHGNESKTVVIK